MEIGQRVTIRCNHFVDVNTINNYHYHNVRGYHGTIVYNGGNKAIAELDTNIRSTYSYINGKPGHCLRVSLWYLRPIKSKIPNGRRRITILTPIVNGLFYCTDTNKKPFYIKNKTKKELPINKSIIVRGGFKSKIFEVWNLEE